MLKKVINPVLFFPLALFIHSQEVLSNGEKSLIDKVLEEKSNKPFISYQDIEKIVLNNEELKSLQNLVTSASFNLSSQIGQRYPSLDFQANGLPKYVSGKKYNSNSETLKTSQFTANPSLNIKWDLIDPLRRLDIKIAKENFKIAENNYEIKKKDLIQEARMRYHKYQKSYQDIKNKKFTLDLSVTSLNNAKAKLESGIGTKFEVIEAEAQLSRDKQSLNEKKIENEINKISLKEILNIKGDFAINQEQNLTGFWNHRLNKNINEGLNKNLSLKNLLLQNSIKKSQAKSFLSQNKPNIYISNIFASTFSKGDSLSNKINSEKSGSNYTNTISLNFAWSIFNGGQNKNSYKSKIADAGSDKYAYKNLKNVLTTNISKAYLNLKLNEEKIISSLKEIESSKESVRLSRLRYDVGISTLKDVLVRQSELSNAKSKHINALYNYNLNLDELERLTFLEINKNCLDKNNNEIQDKESICSIQR
ncbi:MULTISPECIES: TolC family protein [Prochlorococcus]|uniref:Outer membrane efflux protein n=1 Tax=Prochlorococcus marinus str. MIT 9116 TaxID=167544 RepID=A0A0A1ZL20_PROMR|nr:TolC family protein [Prochlorococcus marinus]KGF89314.1 Outer membrane efflux protein precursor [Prochlorococcus marinus str. MIT 9107]KGF90070.1 Outer membrane efflux protein precursor [Prochlorococcus marinus str. MIT 9116]KGF95506.1 Outer membrane efflux protein precursor [Prochlorococcus marinus str. MIT 9123]